jgi:hypothetical protein
MDSNSIKGSIRQDLQDLKEIFYIIRIHSEKYYD